MANSPAGVTTRVSEFTGLNERAAITALKDQEARVAQNLYIDKGTLRKRKGYVTTGNDTAEGTQVLGLHGYYKIDGTKTLLKASGTTVYKQVGSTWTSIVTGLTSNTPISFETANNQVYMSNGVDTVQRYDGNSVVADTAVPKGNILKYHKNILFVAGVSSTPARLYFSNIGAPSTFDAVNGYIDVNANDGESIVAVEVLFDQLVIFKERSVWSLLGSSIDNFQLVNRNSPVGCLAKRSVKRVIKGLMFLGSDGQVYLYKDLVDPIPVSFPIPLSMATVNLDSANVAAAGYFDNKYRLSVPTGTNAYNDTNLVFDELKEAWTTQTGIHASCWLVYHSGVKDNLFFGDSGNSALVYQAETGDNDNGAAINMIWASKEFTIGATERDKNFRTLGIFAQQEGNWSITVEDNRENYGWNSQGTMNLLGNNKALGVDWTLGTDPLGTQGKLFEQFILEGPDIKTYQLRLSNNGANQPVEVNEIQLKADVVNARWV